MTHDFRRTVVLAVAAVISVLISEPISAAPDHPPATDPYRQF
jgi:hypothetical protein